MNPLLATLALAVAAPALKEPPKKATPSFVGRWEMDSVVVGGNAIPAPKGTTVEFTADGKYITHPAGTAEPKTGTVSTDLKKDPAEMDIFEGGKTTRAIFKVEGDTMTVCASPDGGVRPTKLESPAGGQTFLLVLKRIKKD